MVDKYDFKTADTLLKRNWFVDDNDLLDLLYTTDNNAWERICNNAGQYSDHIRDMIQEFSAPPKIKMKVRNIDDNMYTKILVRQKRAMDDRMSADWIEHMKTLPPRPRRVADDLLDQSWEKLCALRSRKGKYTVTEAQMLLAKNEYESDKAVVDEADRIYLYDKKDEFRIKYLLKV